jgi:hypothetical protein
VDLNPSFSFVHQAEVRSLAMRLGVELPEAQR